MEQRVRVHRVRLGGSEVRVVRSAPGPGATGLALRDDGHWLSMYADREGADRLAALWALAARSSRSLVHLPLRNGPAPRDGAGGGEPVALDLVLLHHSLRFPTSSWKEVRARLGAGTPHTVSLPDDDLPDPDAVDHERRHHRTYRDRLGFDVAAHTLFVVGSSTAFREEGAALRDFAGRAAAHRRRYPASPHFCVELFPGPRGRGRTRRHVPGSLHIEYRDDRERTA
ncbi:hypothetical protein ACIGW0_27655 [Streptomyces bikiniensis]|uniref:Uncharacterized protein n=1 Tax=Streptomyces bikiniensis TaxID=1896 RepID=A0ABW8CZU7_STRBI